MRAFVTQLELSALLLIDLWQRNNGYKVALSSTGQRLLLIPLALELNTELQLSNKLITSSLGNT